MHYRLVGAFKQKSTGTSKTAETERPNSNPKNQI
jgi:hypothetical protein